jgi:Zn-dependent protease
MDLNLAELIAVYALPVILAITLHEAAHGYVAMRFGDLTAYAAGRVTLNPVRHIDPIGTVLLPLILLAIGKLTGGGGVLFGWAKPVPVNFGNLRRPKRDMLWVAMAGPGSNFVMALLWAIVLKVNLVFPQTQYAVPLALMGAAGIYINVIFMVLNLLPLPPLDGGRMLVSVLPHDYARRVAQLERWGFPILLLLLFTGVLGAVLWPFIHVTITGIAYAFDVPVYELMKLGNLF